MIELPNDERVETRSPEQALWVAVLKGATDDWLEGGEWIAANGQRIVTDAKNGTLGADPVLHELGERLHRLNTARQFFFGGESSTLEMICELLGYNAPAIRERLLAHCSVKRQRSRLARVDMWLSELRPIARDQRRAAKSVDRRSPEH